MSANPSFLNMQKILIVRALFNQVITKSLWWGVQKCFSDHGVDKKQLVYLEVPGSFEIPWALNHHLQKGSFQGAIALGCIVRGNTPHFDYVCDQTSSGIQQVSLDLSLPIAFGILTVDNFEQAIKRSSYTTDNKGYEATLSVFKTIPNNLV